LHAKVHLHGDPALERRKNRIEASNTFGLLVRQYLAARRGQLRERSYDGVRRHLEDYCAPLHALPLAAIDQGAIARLLNTVARSGAVTANRTRATLSALFTWAMKEGLALSNPAANTNKREERPRDRVLSAAELSAIWRALNGDDYGAIVKLLMLTGQRAGEIAGLRWDEIDFQRGLISLPGARTKNKRAHDIPMSPMVRELLQSRARTERDSVFGRRGRSFSNWTKHKQALDARTGPLPHWVIHDLPQRRHRHGRYRHSAAHH
jgi:integrase